MVASEPPAPRLGDFSEVFRVIASASPRPDAREGRPALSPSPSLVRSFKERPASRPVARRTPGPTGSGSSSIGFLSGIERFLTPLPLPDEDSTASETDEASEDDASDSPDADAPAEWTEDSSDVAIVSASTSPATAAVAAVAVAVAAPLKRASLIPKTAPRRLAQATTTSPPPSSPPPLRPMAPAYVPPPLVGNMIVPLRAESRATKLARIDARLAGHARLNNTATPQHAHVHVFVDLSNIAIGFINRLRLERGVPPEKRVLEPPLFFGGLARVLERGRPVERRVTAGSVRVGVGGGGGTGDDDDHRHAYMVEAERLGYEMNLLRRVPAATPFTTSATAEQAVDEVLQLKMCHSVLDAEPGTLVLATGDGAAAEFSDGFLRHVQRALVRGWCVELVAWRQGIAAAWRQLAREHRGQFRIVELDGFVHELHGCFSGQD